MSVFRNPRSPRLLVTAVVVLVLALAAWEGASGVRNVAGSRPTTSDVRRSEKVASPREEASSLSPPHPLSIVVQLSGEMGNNLGHLAQGIALQAWLKQDYHVTAELVLRHQDRPKWERGRAAVTRCFPWTRTLDWTRGNDPRLDNLLEEKPPPRWLATSTALLNKDPKNATAIQQGLELVLDLWKRNGTVLLLDNNTTLSHPFVYANLIACLDVYVDRYIDTIRALLLPMDRTACCAAVPAANETVFHFRNFVAEMPRLARRGGYEELAPNATADMLQAAGATQVVLTTRVVTEGVGAQAYVQALAERHHIPARILTQGGGESQHADVYDFCFLASTPYELVGSARSTFVLWAALLSPHNGTATPSSPSSPIVRLYSVNSTRTRAVGADHFHFMWKHAHDLKRRWRFEVYAQE